MRTAAGLDAGDAIRRQRPRAHQEFGIPFGVDVVGDRGDVVTLAHGLAEQIHQRGFFPILRGHRCRCEADRLSWTYLMPLSQRITPGVVPAKRRDP